MTLSTTMRRGAIALAAIVVAGSLCLLIARDSSRVTTSAIETVLARYLPREGLSRAVVCLGVDTSRTLVSKAGQLDADPEVLLRVRAPAGVHLVKNSACMSMLLTPGDPGSQRTFERATGARAVRVWTARPSMFAITVGAREGPREGALWRCRVVPSWRVGSCTLELQE